MSRRRARNGDEIRKPGESSRWAERVAEEPRIRISRFAKVTRLATEQSQDEKDVKSKLENVDNSLLERIQKMLKLAQHPNTSEAEAKQAIRASTRMLSSYNLTEADVMAHESASEQLQRAGHSIVTVRHREGKAVSLEQWSVTLGHAIGVAFNVKYFYTRYRTHQQIDFTFYGLRDNTVTAVMSFEAIFNLALTWALDRQDVKGRSGKNSYLVGLSDSLYRIARNEKKEEEQQAIAFEKSAIENAERRARDQDKVKEDRLGEDVNSRATAVTDEEEDADDIIFISLKPGRGRGLDGVQVKKEKVEKEEEGMTHASGSVDDDDTGGLDFGMAGAADDGDEDDEDMEDMEDMEDDLGDVEEERRRFDTAFNAQNRDVLGSRNLNASVKRERGEDEVKPDVKPTLAVKPDVGAEGGASRPTKVEESEAQVPTWHSHVQLTVFKETAARVAEEYLKTLESKVKTTKARARSSAYDSEAYRKGAEDAKKVDMKRKRLA